MIYVGIIIIALLVIGLVIKLLKSAKFEKWSDDLVKGKVNADPIPKNIMKDITKEESTLGKQSETNIKEAEKLTEESEGINDFLTTRGVSQDEKKEDS